MRKRQICIGVLLVFIISLLASGCTVKSSSSAVGVNENDSQINTVDGETSEKETQEMVRYKSLIEKYVGMSGTTYKAHDYMLKKPVTNKYSSEEWLDSDGRLRLPFVPDDIKETDTSETFGEYKVLYESTGLACYYVPDELAAKASTGELADIFMSYGYNSGIILSLVRQPDYREFEHEFEYGLSHCNALEESLRRDDFAVEYFKRYMTESENIPEYYEGMAEESFDLYSSGVHKTGTLNMLEVILAQPEAYAQLTDPQRETLVRRVIEKEKLGEQGKLFYSDTKYYETFFFACIAGELYLPADMAAISDITGGLSGVTGAIQCENSPWLDTIKAMDLTEDEQNILDKYFGGSEQS